jgi:CHASE1-domain containing sensor protein
MTPDREWWHILTLADYLQAVAIIWGLLLVVFLVGWALVNRAGRR